ncbi:MAG: hypothetical protein CMJ50_02765 [Planctomycetaceae bacterium]|nr:hypothetical protein [Planctomycetaceae bacterium]
MHRSVLPLAIVGTFLLIGPVSTTRSAEPDAKGIEFFEKKIRPVLVKHCYECHSATSKEIEGELLLDTREATRKGGESGHAVVPGNLKESLLINALRFEDFEMPPDEPLPESVIADFEKWIKLGAPDPREGKMPVARKELDIEKAREFWSFSPIRKSSPPKIEKKSWPRTDIDRFVLARLESKGLEPNMDADPRVLVRRVYFDLIGLPPTPEQVNEFIGDPSAAALEQLIDRLLDSPQFGERWGRHWLDVVRYGESTGMERNFTFPYAWRYRDYVIQSFNKDKPFDRFIAEQVAGDLLPADNIDQRNEQLIATGVLAIGTKSLNETNREKFMMDVVDEQIDVTTQAFMAFTVSCARCHDHKFDPIPNEDYYSLAGIFRSTETFYGTGKLNGNRQQGKLLALGPKDVEPVATGGATGRKGNTTKKLANQLKAAQRRLQQLRKQASKNDAAVKRTAAAEAQVKKLQAQMRKSKRNAEAQTAKPDPATTVLVMAVQDAADPSDTALRIRGEANERGDTIPRGVLTILTPEKEPEIESDTSGRLQYAQWITSPHNPLTSRVAVNRIWMHLFGRGIVATVNNFGATGDRPTHPELLDNLAIEFVENGWSVKQLIRTVMNSRVYQLAGVSNTKAEEVDPDNNLLWRMNQRRLEVEAIRDSILLASGELDLSPGNGSIVESIGDGDIGRNLRPDQFAVASIRRSVYLPIVRGAVPEILQVFDFPDPSIIFGQREVTTVPTQALFMMNSPFVIEQSGHFARRVLAEEGFDAAGRVDLAYRLALARSPTMAEVEAATEFIRDATESLAESQSKSDAAKATAWTSFCQTLFACSEFRYLD